MQPICFLAIFVSAGNGLYLYLKTREWLLKLTDLVTYVTNQVADTTLHH